MARTAEWFNSLTKKAQREYLVKHPNSKYGKKAGKAAAKPTVKDRSVERSKVISAQKKQLDKRVTSIADQLAEAKAAKAKARTPTAKDKHHQKVLKLQRDLASAKRMAAGVKAPAAKAKTPASKAKAHEVKRAADKNKVVAKTRSAVKAKVPVKKPLTAISGKSPQELKLKQTISGLRLSLQGFSKTSPGYAARMAKYKKAQADLKALKAKAKAK